MNDIKSLLEKAKKVSGNKIAVAVAEDKEVLKSVEMGYLEGISEYILVGDEIKIRDIAKKNNIDIKNHKIIDYKDNTEACEIAVKLVKNNEANALMKGLIDTSVILKASLNKEWGLRTGNLISHLAVFEMDTYKKLLFVTDCAININPDLEAKKSIVKNSLKALNNLGLEEIKVGVICAKEKMNPKMQSTVDAVELVKEFSDKCIIEGPVAMDGAISKKASEIKGIDSKIAGDVDLVVMDNIEAGNVLYKTLTYLCEAQNGGVVLGTLKPIILTSRADSAKSKLISMALGVLS